MQQNVLFSFAQTLSNLKGKFQQIRHELIPLRLTQTLEEALLALFAQHSFLHQLLEALPHLIDVGDVVKGELGVRVKGLVFPALSHELVSKGRRFAPRITNQQIGGLRSERTRKHQVVIALHFLSGIPHEIQHHFIFSAPLGEHSCLNLAGSEQEASVGVDEGEYGDSRLHSELAHLRYVFRLHFGRNDQSKRIATAVLEIFVLKNPQSDFIEFLFRALQFAVEELLQIVPQDEGLEGCFSSIGFIYRTVHFLLLLPILFRICLALVVHLSRLLLFLLLREQLLPLFFHQVCTEQEQGGTSEIVFEMTLNGDDWVFEELDLDQVVVVHQNRSPPDVVFRPYFHSMHFDPKESEVELVEERAGMQSQTNSYEKGRFMHQDSRLDWLVVERDVVAGKDLELVFFPFKKIVEVEESAQSLLPEGFVLVLHYI